MTLQAALLRGVNLGKRKMIMSELREVCEACRNLPPRSVRHKPSAKRGTTCSI